MRWGCCGDLERLAQIEQAGYDFIESPVRALHLDGPPQEAERYRDAVLASRLSAEAFNVFLPGTLPIVGPDVDHDCLRQHVTSILETIQGLSTEIIVLGSGGARKIPDGWSTAEAEKQFVSFCHLAADLVGPADITIVIEPLARSACNYIHTVSEAQALAEQISRPEIEILADLHHMTLNGDAIDTLPGLVPHLKHVHLPVPNIPNLIAHDTDYDFVGYLSALKTSGYTGRISVEDNGKRFGDFATEAGPVLNHLKGIWDSV